MSRTDPLPWIDLDLVTRGYLLTWDGHFRPIPELDTIARDTLMLGARVRWGTPPQGTPACCYYRRREIVLSPALLQHDGYVLRRVWTHELGHIATGRPCDEHARWWQWRRYRELIVPPWAVTGAA